MGRNKGRYYDTIITTPSIKKSLLARNDLVGWGSKVAIIDSGLSDNSIIPTAYKDFTDTGINDKVGHGTYIAKIIHFLAKGASLYIAKVGNGKPDQANVVKALKWAIDVGVNLINISCGFDDVKPHGNRQGSCFVCKAVNMAINNGITVVIAAGNNGDKGIPISCPGVVDRAVTVGATDENGLALYSSRGEIGSLKPDILAPGTIHIDGKPYTGTSFAAPIVTGVLAATLNKYHCIENTIAKLFASATDLGLPVNHQGHGAIDLNKFLLEVQREEIDDRSKGYS